MRADVLEQEGHSGEGGVAVWLDRRKRGLVVYLDDGVEVRVDRCDGAQAGVGGFPRGYFARPDQLTQTDTVQ
ncbi:hypothetical protein ACFSTD_01635 [Novosphingobium colocasiae]